MYFKFYTTNIVTCIIRGLPNKTEMMLVCLFKSVHGEMLNFFFTHVFTLEDHHRNVSSSSFCNSDLCMSPMPTAGVPSTSRPAYRSCPQMWLEAVLHMHTPVRLTHTLFTFSIELFYSSKHAGILKLQKGTKFSGILWLC